MTVKHIKVKHNKTRCACRYLDPKSGEGNEDEIEDYVVVTRAQTPGSDGSQVETTMMYGFPLPDLHAFQRSELCTTFQQQEGC